LTVTQPARKIRDIAEFDARDIFGLAATLDGPAVFRGLASNWPLVQKSLSSPDEACQYLRNFYQGAPVTAFVSEARLGGRIFYKEDLSAMDFEQVETNLDWVLDRMGEHVADAGSPFIYMGSSAVDFCLPGFSAQNALRQEGVSASVRIWIGNQTSVAAHYDVMYNIACVCAGRRRFTLFPPDQMGNLYVGPVDLTPAGQQISLVDLNRPDLDRYPRFAEALAQAQSAELGPGDAIFIPSMWWHHVEGLEDFNILVNHWWRDVPGYMGAPGDALLHAIMNIRALPAAERAAWRGIFDRYVFGDSDAAVEHIPVQSRGVLGELDERMARTLRAMLRNKLNR